MDPDHRYRSQRIVPDIGPKKKRTRTIRTMDHMVHDLKPLE